MTKLLLLAVGLFLFAPGDAAAQTAIYDQGYSTIAVKGFRCSTGTISQINLTRPAGFQMRVAGYRVQNQDSADAVWIGGASVSTSTLAGAEIDLLGEKLIAGANAPYSLHKDPIRPNTPNVPIYCLAADAAGAGGVIVSVAWFGF